MIRPAMYMLLSTIFSAYIWSQETDEMFDGQAITEDEALSLLRRLPGKWRLELYDWESDSWETLDMYYQFVQPVEQTRWIYLETYGEDRFGPTIAVYGWNGRRLFTQHFGAVFWLHYERRSVYLQICEVDAKRPGIYFWRSAGADKKELSAFWRYANDREQESIIITQGDVIDGTIVINKEAPRLRATRKADPQGRPEGEGAKQ